MMMIVLAAWRKSPRRRSRLSLTATTKMSVSAARGNVGTAAGRRPLPLETTVEQSQLDDILNDLLTDPLFAGNARSFDWSNDADGTYGSISPKHGSITTHSGHGGRTVVSWQMNQDGPTSTVAVNRQTVDRQAAGGVVETDSSRRVQTTASSRPATGPGGRYESHRFESRSEKTSRHETASKPQPPVPPVRRQLFSPESFNHVDGPATHPQQQASKYRVTTHMSDTEDASGPRSRWVDEQRRSTSTKSQTSRQQRSTWRPGPTTVVQSDTEDYFRPSFASTERRAAPSVPHRWHSTSSYYDDPYMSDSGLLSSRRSRTLQSGRSSGTRTYDLESGRLFETKKSFFVSGLERPARRGPDTKYTFSISPQRSLPADEFPTKASRAAPPAQTTPLRSSTSPILPPLRSDSSREAVLRVNTTREFASKTTTGTDTSLCNSADLPSTLCILIADCRSFFVQTTVGRRLTMDQ